MCSSADIISCSFFFNDPATTEIYTYRHALSLHDALPILSEFMAYARANGPIVGDTLKNLAQALTRLLVDPEEHTSEFQSLMRTSYAVFCLKKKKTSRPHAPHSFSITQVSYLSS